MNARVEATVDDRRLVLKWYRQRRQHERPYVASKELSGWLAGIVADDVVAGDVSEGTALMQRRYVAAKEYHGKVSERYFGETGSGYWTTGRIGGAR